AALMPMALALAIFPGWTEVALILGLFLVLEITIANLVEPWLYGSHTGVSALAILVAAIFWGMLWGSVGLILSTPLTMCLLLFGRSIPQLTFFEILSADEPVLSPPAHFYQRLLAMDEDEARDVVQDYLRDKPLESLYDSVLVPALSLAETDRHNNILDQARAEFIHQSAREMIQELVEKPDDDRGESQSCAVRRTSQNSILCIPAKDEADELVAMMAAHALRRAGYAAAELPMNTTQISASRAGLICVSALPPFAALHAKSLCRRIRETLPHTTVILCLWDF